MSTRTPPPLPPPRGSYRRRARHRAATAAATAVVVAASFAPVVEALESRTLLSLTLVKDINPSTTAPAPPQSIADVNGTLFVSAGGQLWKTDGTQAGTVEVSSNNLLNPTSMTSVGATLFFDSNGTLWKSDGTDAGTVQLAGVNASDLTNVNGMLYFRASDGAGSELWKSDGTAAGTVRVKDINPGSGSSDPRGFTNVNGKLFFHASDGAHGDELWTSDGTDAGTVMVKDINTGASGSEPLSLTNVNGTLFFIAHSVDNSGYELWKSDGTPTGTVQVKDIRPGLPGSSPTMLHAVNGKLMFCATDGQHGYELWISDGTDAGTQMVKDIVPGGGSPVLDNFAVVGSTLFFSANDGTNGIELWKSDGTAAGTVMVKDIAPGVSSSDPGEFTPVSGGKLIFTANDGTTGQELWISDGTAAGTHLLKETYPGPVNFPISYITPSGSNFYFIGDEGPGPSLWMSDLSTAGTAKLRSFTFTQAQSSTPSGGMRIGSTIYFTADDGVHGVELWKSDGTTAGTSLVADLNPGINGSYPAELTNFNGTLYFAANGKLYSTDGTTAGTVPVSAITMSPSKLTVVGNTLYFLGFDGGGQELWKSDGTAAGTVRVKDINPGGESSSADYLTNVNGTLFFVADDGTRGIEVWKSDGSDAGTVMVKDILTGAASSGPALLTNVNGTLFFRANDGVNGYELWKSDGSAAGTVMVKDIRPGAGDAYIRSLTAFNSILFFVADDGVHGEELWSSDGTAGGTQMLKDINAGEEGSTPDYLSNLGNAKFVFKADDGVHGEELWTSDGTPGGTVLLKDIFPGATGSNIQRAFIADGSLFFYAFPNSNTIDLYVTDGTAIGTYGLNYPPDHLLPSWVVKLNGQAYFESWAYATGSELYSTPVTPPSSLTASGATTTTAATTTTTPSTSKLAQQQATFAAAQASNALSGSDDAFYDDMLYSDKPQTEGASGLSGALLVGGDLRADWDLNYADEAAVRADARRAFAAGEPLIVDIENWPVDQRSLSEAVVQMNLEKLEHVVDWAHDECPGVQVGFFGLVPIDIRPAPAPGSPGYAAWHAANDRVKALIDRVDILLPGTYTSTSDPAVWVADDEVKIAEGKLFGKVVRPFIWPEYFGFPGNATIRQIPGTFWREQLDVDATEGDGAAIWSGGGAWDDDSPWWTITRDFLIDSTPIAPATATNLSAIPVNASRIDLSWKDNAYNESGFRIERKIDGDPGSFAAIATVGMNVTTYSDTGLAAGVTYDYRVIATNSDGDGAASNQASATTADVAPVAPTNPGATALSASRIQLTWTDASANEDGFAIDRAPVGGNFTQIDTVGENIPTFTDTGLAPGVTYRYRIRAFNTAGSSPASAEVSVATLPTNSDLVAHWALDENGGTTAADTAGGNPNGTLLNGATWTSAGVLGSAISFDGIDDRVDVPDSPALDFANGTSFTLSAWVYLPALPNKYVGVIMKNYGGGNFYGISIDETNHWRFPGQVDVVGTVATTGWTLVTAVEDAPGAQRKLYVNGALVGTGSSESGDGTGLLLMGGTGAGGQYFAGKIDDVRIYGRALSGNEVAALANPHVTLAGTLGDDAWTVRLDAAGANYEFLQGNTVNFTRPIDSVGTIDFAGGVGNDSLTLDFTNGDPLPAYGFTYDGGTASAGGSDTLQLQGGGISLGLFADGSHVTHNHVAMLTYSNVEALSVSGATLNATGDLATNLAVGSQGIAVLDTTQHLSSLTIGAGGLVRLAAGGDKVLVLGGALSIAPTASLDLADDKLILHSLPIGSWNGSNYTSVAGMLSLGRNAGLWSGGGGIITSDSRAQSANGSPAQATLAAAKVGDIRSGVADNQTTLYAGQTVLGSDTVVVFTYAGDFTLDGKINIDDYLRIDAAISAHLTGYSNGDVNYDGKINIDDYIIIDSNVSSQGGQLFNSSFATADSASSMVIQSSAFAAWIPRSSDDPAAVKKKAEDDTAAALLQHAGSIMTTPAEALRADFSRYARLIEERLASVQPENFGAPSESANTLSIERGVVLPLAVLARPWLVPNPVDRLIEVANSNRLSQLGVIDKTGHFRAVYRPLLIYAWLLAFRIRYETLPGSEFGRWDEALRAWADFLESDLGQTNLTEVTAARGDVIAAAAWSALALHVAGKIFVRDAWTDLASDTFGRLTRSQQSSGAFLLATASDHPEPLWYHELSILHAAASYAAQAEDRPLARAVARATLFHLAETQPDHATTQPWGLFAFLWNPPARPLADQVLHSVTLSQSPDGVSLILLADALYCLRLFI